MHLLLEISVDDSSCVCGVCVCSVVKFGSVIPVRIFMPAAAESHVHCNWRTLENGRPLSLCFSVFQTCLVTFTVLRTLIHVTVLYSATHSFSLSPCARLLSPLLISSALFFEWELKPIGSLEFRSK